MLELFRKVKIHLTVLLLFSLVAACPEAMGKENSVSARTAIVLAVFGTSHVPALPGILDIQSAVRKAFPEVEVRLSFTSRIIRRIWHQRSRDQEFLSAHPDLPSALLTIKGPLAAISDLQDEGYGYIIVQPTYIAAAEEYMDLSSYVDGLNSIRTIKERNRPFKKIILGRPAFGAPGIVHEYRHDIERVARAMADDAEYAGKKGAALVYMGHGNDTFSTGVYLEFAEVMRQMYPQVGTYVSLVEGFPSHDRLLRELSRDGVEKVYLKVMMTVAGIHAVEDMAGEDKYSLKSRLEAKGIEVEVGWQGMGRNKDFAAIFVDNIRAAAKDNDLDL